MVTLAVPALLATVGLPAYAFPADTEADPSAELLGQRLAADAQSVPLAAVQLAVENRDGYDYTSAAEIRQAELRAIMASYSGPSAADYLRDPAYPSFDLDQVVDVALQYQGVPYVFGGASPAGFDCSGLVLFVYAQFGISMPHSSSAQGRGAGGGHIISRADALPGDVVVMDGGGHSGIYMGGNTMVHAPQPGRSVEVHPIWDPNAWFVRYGI